MSKSSELDKKVKLYLLNIMYEGREGENFNINESIKYWNDTFQSEYGWRVKQVGRQTAMIDWLQGLALNGLDFYNYNIIQLAIKWNSIPVNHTEKQADKILDNYWNLMACKLLQLFDGYRVPKNLKGENNG